jgi:RNA polymerase sigma factor (TIGR02999 family)
MHEPQEPAKPVTELLARWQGGDRLALEELLPLVYTELRGVARRHLRRERPGHTLQSAALVNEAYLRLIEQRPFETKNRMHFVAVASRLMRQVLVDHARSHGAAKRGAEQTIHLDASMILPQVQAADVIAVDDALKDLSRLDEQQGRIVEMRFFGGLSNEEIAQFLGISSSTVKRDWNVAKAWLARAIRKGNSDEQGAMAEN